MRDSLFLNDNQINYSVESRVGRVEEVKKEKYIYIYIAPAVFGKFSGREGGGKCPADEFVLKHCGRIRAKGS